LRFSLGELREDNEARGAEPPFAVLGYTIWGPCDSTGAGASLMVEVGVSCKCLDLGENGIRIVLSLCANAVVDPEVSGVCEIDVGPDHNEGTDAVDPF